MSIVEQNAETPGGEEGDGVLEKSYTDSEIIAVLRGYASEAESARKMGDNPRDLVWQKNWDRYWLRYDNTMKANWQSKHVMPESPQLVDRWAAAMREALDAGGEWFMVEDESGRDSPLAIHILKVMKYYLSKCAITIAGHRTDFSSVFEDQMKMGALMTLCASVNWREGRQGALLEIATVDSREVWYDPEGRNLYRRRRYRIDKHKLMHIAAQNPELYKLDVIRDLTAGIANDEQRVEKERTTGSSTGDGASSGRVQIDIDEWLCDVLMPDGTVAGSNVLVVVANEKHIIRGMEENPFSHKSDWIVSCPMVSVPLSIYGKTYMEEWGSVADAFVDMTQLILDGVLVSTLKAFAARPDALKDPTQLAEGITPNVIFQLEEGSLDDPAKFLREIDLGTLPPEAFQVWQSLKGEIREGAKLNEVSLGQAAPNARTTAYEIQSTQQSGSSMIRSMARTIESRWLEPLLNIAWKTILQHADFTTLEDIIGKETASMFNTRRDEFLERKVGFKVRAISGLIDRQAKLQSVLQFLQVVAQNEVLMQQLMQMIDIQTFMSKLFVLFGLDPDEFKPSEKELLMRSVLSRNGAQPQGVTPMQPGAPAPAAAPAPEAPPQ